jgi:hypothetical protein
MIKVFILNFILIFSLNVLSKVKSNKTNASEKLPEKIQVFYSKSLIYERLKNRLDKYSERLTQLEFSKESSIPEKLRKIESKLILYQINKRQVCLGKFNILNDSKIEQIPANYQISVRSDEYKMCRRFLSNYNKIFNKKIFKLRKRYLSKIYVKFMKNLEAEFQKSWKK